MSELNKLMNEEGDQQDSIEQKYLTFCIGDEDYGIPIAHVIEIIGIQSITDLPEVPPWIKGVINLRGRVIPVMDIRLRFALVEREYDDRTCIIVVNMNGENVGLIVDSVKEVMDVDPENITNPPSVSGSTSNQYIEGLGMLDERVVILLDASRLLFGDEIEQISEALK